MSNYPLPETKIARLRALRFFLNKYDFYEFIDEQDFPKIIVLLSNHVRWKQKEGIGIEKIQIIKSDWGDKNYLLHRKDGTTTDISIHLAASGKEYPILSRLKNACRNAIRPIIEVEQQKVLWGEQRCPISGEILTRENTHIDHYDMTFSELFRKWMEGKNEYDMEKYLNDPYKDNCWDDLFIDDCLRNNFILFHNANTHLRAVTAATNMRIAKKTIKRDGDGTNDNHS